MMRRLVFSAAALAVLSAARASAGEPRCPLGDGWALDGQMSDEFDAEVLDMGKWWDFAPWWRGRREYVNRAANVVQTNGVLELWARRIPAESQEYEDRAQGFWPYTCGVVKSRRKVKYGYFEVRAKGAAAEVRNAFWLYDPLSDGIERPWPKYVRGSHSEEIDIYEFIGRFQGRRDRPYEICAAVHRFETPYVEGVVNARQTPLACKNGAKAVGWCPADDYHTYGLLWTPDELVWYVDGEPYHRRRNDHYHTPLHVVLDVEIAKWRGAAPELLDASTLPAVHSIDYFRRWTARVPPVVKSFLRKGDVWVMSGDSITHNDFHRQVVAAALDHFHPGHGVRIMNTAAWGRLVAEAEGQGLDLKPTVASIMLGMNDVIHRDYPAEFDFAEKARAYAEAIRRQVKAFKAKGAEVVLFKPTLTDETEWSYFHVYHTRAGLLAYGEALESVAAEEGCHILPIADDLERFKSKMGVNETLVPDGVHPYGWGQYVIAKALVHHLRLAAPMAEVGEARGSCDCSEVPFNDVRIVRGGAFLADGEPLSVQMVAPRDMVARVRWSVEGSPERGEETVRLAGGRKFSFRPSLSMAALSPALGTVARVIVSVEQEGREPQLAVVDLARTRVFHFRDGAVGGEIRSESQRPEGSLVGTWEVRLDGSDLWFSGRMRAKEWPVRRPPHQDVWMNSSGMNGIMALFDFRPPGRFAENRFDHDVNMVDLSVLNNPWSALPLSWINRRVGNCMLAGVEPTDDGYSWRLGFRGRVNDYTRFDISEHDVFGLYFIFADCEDGEIRHYPVFDQLHGPRRERRINPELRLNQTAVFDVKGVVSGDEVTTVGVFGL